MDSGTSTGSLMIIAVIIFGALVVVAYSLFEPEINSILGTEMAGSSTPKKEKVEVYSREKELKRNTKSLYTTIFSDTLVSEVTHVPLMGKSEKRAVKEEYPEMRITNSMKNTYTKDNDFDYFVETVNDELYYLDIELNYLEGDTVERQLVEEGTDLHGEYLASLD